jgi:hypothetical protein
MKTPLKIPTIELQKFALMIANEPSDLDLKLLPRLQARRSRRVSNGASRCDLIEQDAYSIIVESFVSDHYA